MHNNNEKPAVWADNFPGFLVSLRDKFLFYEKLAIFIAEFLRPFQAL